MAVAQHQFYLDKKQNRDNISQFKSLNDLANDLNKSSNSAGAGSSNGKESAENKSFTSGSKTSNGGIGRKAVSMNNMSVFGTANENKKCMFFFSLFKLFSMCFHSFYFKI
jgi:hypothetical protein